MRVKELLKERGMTAKELAARLGMTETGLSIAIEKQLAKYPIEIQNLLHLYADGCVLFLSSVNIWI